MPSETVRMLPSARFYLGHQSWFAFPVLSASCKNAYAQIFCDKIILKAIEKKNWTLAFISFAHGIIPSKFLLPIEIHQNKREIIYISSSIKMQHLLGYQLIKLSSFILYVIKRFWSNSAIMHQIYDISPEKLAFHFIAQPCRWPNDVESPPSVNIQ